MDANDEHDAAWHADYDQAFLEALIEGRDHQWAHMDAARAATYQQAVTRLRAAGVDGATAHREAAAQEYRVFEHIQAQWRAAQQAEDAILADEQAYLWRLSYGFDDDAEWDAFCNGDVPDE